MHEPAEILTGFVLEHLPTAPLARQIEIYRALARLSGSEADRARFEKLATDCEAILAAHDQLLFDFRQKARRKREGNGSNGT